MARKSSSNSLWGDSLPFSWTATIRTEVRGAIANNHVLSLKYRVKLKQVRRGTDKTIWRHDARSSWFECGDG